MVDLTGSLRLEAAGIEYRYARTLGTGGVDQAQLDALVPRAAKAAEAFAATVETGDTPGMSEPVLWPRLGEGDEATTQATLDWAERARDIPNCQYWATAHAVVALAHMDRADEARKMVEALLAEAPVFTHAFAERKLFYLKRPEQLKLYLDGLDKAGVPQA